MNDTANNEEAVPEMEDRVIAVNRCSKVVKGGRRFSFSALVVVGNHNGLVGYGFGKANEVADAIRKATEIAKRNMVSVKMKGQTIPHTVTGECDGGQVLLRPAGPGTGVIAGGGVRAILDLAGVHDVLGKSLGSNNKINVVKATFAALEQLRTRDEVTAIREMVV